jgi:hypothetical protein
MHKGNLIDQLIESVQMAEQHAVENGGGQRNDQRITRTQAYSEYLYDTWFNAEHAGVA